MEKTAGIVIIGDEILSGKFADENAAYLIGALADLGVSLRRVAMIPDDLDDIATTVRRFSDSFDFVVTSGGVGPTHDDLTMAGIARAFDTDIILHPQLEAMVRGHWGEAMPEANLRLARVPRGAMLVTGETSRWPVISFHNVYILPGVPRLFRQKFDDIKERFRCPPIGLVRMYVNAEEGLLAPHLDRAVHAFPQVKLGSYPRWGERAFQVILTLESRDADALSRATDDLARALGDWVVTIEPARPA